MELGFMDMMRTAAVICDDCLKVQPGEKVVIVADSRNHDYHGSEQIVQALMAVMAERGLDPTMIYYEARKDQMQQKLPEIASYAIQNADVVISETSILLLYSPTFGELIKNQSNRAIFLPEAISIEASPDELYRMLPKSKEELLETHDLMHRVGDKLKGNHEVHFSAANGTDITLKLAPVSGFPGGGVSLNDGMCDKKGKITLLPAGSIVCMIVDGSVNGKLVVDAENSSYVGLLPDAATLTFKDGILTDIDGDGVSADLIRKFMKTKNAAEMTNYMPEFGMGFNPNAQLNGNFSEGEMIYGCVHIGIGALTTGHIDNIVPEATCEVDGELILKDGKYLV